MRSTFLFICSFFVQSLFGQNSYTVQQCEELFQKNNLLLLAEQYNIDAAQAAVVQAKIWEHPYVSGEFNFVNPQDKKILNAGANGQKSIAVQQLIYLGGKKKKEIEAAKGNVAVAVLQYEDLLRSLRFEIRQNFYGIYFNQNKVTVIQSQLSTLQSLMTAYDEQAKKGNVPLKDVVRLQSLSLSLKKELMDIQQEIFSRQESLKILTNTTENIAPIVAVQEIEDKFTRPLASNETQLFELAVQKNPAYLVALKTIESNELQLKWQRSLSVPDITVGASYDQRGGAFNNQVNLTVGIPLPFWNKNKGNIKIAEAQLAQNRVGKEQKLLELKTQIATLYQIFAFQQQQYKQSLPNFENFGKVYDGVLQNFQKRNISLIEFTDFMESYNQSMLYINEVKKQVLLYGETINLFVNDTIF